MKSLIITILLVAFQLSAQLVTPVQYLANQTKPNFATGNHLPHLTRWGNTLGSNTCVSFAKDWGYCLPLSNYATPTVASNTGVTGTFDSGMATLASNNPTVYKLSVLVDRTFTNVPSGMWSTNSSGLFVDYYSNVWDVTVFSNGEYVCSTNNGGGDFRLFHPFISPESPDEYWTNISLYPVGSLKTIKSNAPITIVLNGGEYGLQSWNWGGRVWNQDVRVQSQLVFTDPWSDSHLTGMSWPRYVSGKKAHYQGYLTGNIQSLIPNRELSIFYNTDNEQFRDYRPTDLHWMDKFDTFGWWSSMMNTNTDSPSFEMYYNSTAPGGWTNVATGLLTEYLNAVGFNVTLGYPTNYTWVSGGWGDTISQTNNFSDIPTYTGFLKCLYTAGMRGGIAGYFTLPNLVTNSDGTTNWLFGGSSIGMDSTFPSSSPPSWIQQMTALSHVHALFSHLDPFFDNGQLISGPQAHAMSTDQPAYEFTNTVADTNSRVLSRKSKINDSWLITAWSANGSDRNVTVSIPTLGSQTVTASSTGTVYYATLSGKQIVNEFGPSFPNQNWYVDSSKTGTSDNSGTSQANAFTNWMPLGGLDGQWTSVAHGGDTVWVFPGVGYVGNKTGSPDAIVMFNILGVTNNPIIFKAIQTNGLVKTPPFVVTGSFFTFDGRLSDTYTNLVNFDNLANVYQITNNINWWMRGVYGFGTNIQNGIYCPNSGPQMRFTWIHIDPYTFNTNNYPFGSNPTGPGSTTHGVNILQNTGELLDGFELGYCYIEEADQCCVNILNNNAPKWQQGRIHHNVMTKQGDAGARLAGGFEVDHNIIGTAWTIHGHPNGIVQSPSYSLFHHNVVLNPLDTIMYTPGGGSPMATGIKVYNNLFYTTKDWSFIYTNQFSSNLPFVNHSIGGIQFLVEANANNTEPWLPQVWTNFVFAGNTMICGLGAVPTNSNAGLNSATSLPNRYAPGNSVSFEPGLDRGFVILTNFLVVNNLIYNVSPAGSGQTLGGWPGWVDRFNAATNTWTNNSIVSTAGILFDPNNVNGGNRGSTNLLLDYNVLTADQAASKSFAYNGPFSTNSTFPTAEHFGAAYVTNGYAHNSSALPLLVDTNNYVFQPRVSDTTLVGRGTNLSSWSLAPGGLPQYNVDLAGRSRPSRPSIGAYEPQYDMILHYTFDDLIPPNPSAGFASAVGQQFGGVLTDGGHAVTFDSTGNILTTGWFSTNSNFLGTTLTSAGGLDIFVTKTTPAGSLIWAKRYGGTGDETVTRIALDSSDNIFLGGYFSGTSNLGGTNMVSAGQNDIFLAKFDASGNFLWSERFGSTGNDVLYGLAVDSTGAVIMDGTYSGTVSFGGATFHSIFGGDTGYIAKYTTAGAHLWSMSIAGGNANFPQGLATDSGNNVIVSGYFFSSINLGGGSISAGGPSNPNIFIGKFDSSGVFVWQKGYTSTSSQRDLDITVDSGGDVVMTGDFTASCNLGGGVITGTGAQNDMWVAKYSGVDGSYIWAQPATGTISAQPAHVTTDSQKNVVATGYYLGTLNFGSGQFISSLGVSYNVFLTSYSSSGTLLKAQSFGGTLTSQGFSVAINSAGFAVLTGAFSGPGNFGTPLTSFGSYDVFLMSGNLFGTGAIGVSPIVQDITGYNSHMLYWGFVNTPTNWPKRLAYTNTIGSFNSAAEFVSNLHPVPAYGNFTIAQFGGVTNIGVLSNLSAITVSVWMKYYSSLGDTKDNSATIIDTCEGSPGGGATWSLGRNSAFQTSFDLFTNRDYNTSLSLHLNYPDNESVDWHFYAATFNTTNKQMNIYLDGTNCGFRDMTPYNLTGALTNLIVGVPSTGGSYGGKNGWLSIGCRTHVGSPNLADSDLFPNNAWMDGQVADLRVYNRELSGGEVLSIYNGGGGGNITPTPPNPVPPNITQQPVSTNIFATQTALFTVTAIGSPVLGYRWTTNGVAAGTNGPALSVGPAPVAWSGMTVVCVVTNGFGTNTSSTATLTVGADPVITGQPANATVGVGSTATFTVTATGQTAITHQWSKNGTPIGGATLSSYTTPATVAADNNSHFLDTVTDTAGSTNSATATLTVTNIVSPPDPVITAQPQSISIFNNQIANFSVTATGGSTIHYQWQTNGVNTGTDANTLTFGPCPVAWSGIAVRVIVSNLGVQSPVTSSTATLTIGADPVITVQPQNATATNGTRALFTVTATGQTPRSFQWFTNGVSISGATQGQYTTPLLSSINNGDTYFVDVTDTAGTLRSATATLTVITPIPPPPSVKIAKGKELHINVTHNGP